MDGFSEHVPSDQPVRKKGQKMSQEERQALPVAELLGNLTKFIRRDFGGKENQIAVVAKKARAWAAKKDLQFTDAGFEKLAEFGMEFAGDQLDGCRIRTADTVAELRRRMALLHTVLELLEKGLIKEATPILERVIEGTTAKAPATLF